MGSRRDYVPSRETNLTDRMNKGASLEDGLAGRATAQKDGVSYRTYRNADGSQDTAKKWNGTNEINEDWGIG